MRFGKVVQGDCAGSDSPIPRSGAKNSVASCRVVCGAIDMDNMEPPNSLPTFRFGEIFQHTGSILASHEGFDTGSQMGFRDGFRLC